MHSTLPTRLCALALLALAAAVTLASCPTPPASADAPYLLSLPLILKQASSHVTPPPVPPEQLALARVNAYRALAGVRSLALDPALITAAQRHADYDLLNAPDVSAWEFGPHGEVAGKPGFSGTWPGDRAVAAGYAGSAGWEVISHFDDPERAVDGLMATVFHRVNILTATHAHLGYGHGENATEAVDVLDFGRGASEPAGPPGVALYPGPDQREVPLYGAGETPSPLPPGAAYPIGYPVTIQPLVGTTLTVSAAELRDPGGTLVPLYPSPPDCARSCYALLPVSGLRAGTTYTAHVAGALDGVEFDTTWSFTTTACDNPLLCSEVKP